MKIKQIRSHLAFNRSQRVGIILLLVVFIGLLYIQFFVSFSEEKTFDISSPRIVAWQKQMDSLRLKGVEINKPKIYPFNPNFISDYKAYTLGIAPEAYDRLKTFRERDQWINSVSDFKRVTQVSDSILEKISPYFKFPEWVNSPKPKNKIFTSVTSELPYSKKIDLNMATLDELQHINGIGEALSKRIVQQREKLGGFSNDQQLHTIWGLKQEVVHRIMLQFTVKTPTQIDKMNINKSSASDLATIPGVSFESGKKIWEFVRLREGIKELSELLKIEGFTPRQLQVFELYLYAE